MYFYVLFNLHFVKAWNSPHTFSVHTLAKIDLVRFRSRSSIGSAIKWPISDHRWKKKGGLSNGRVTLLGSESIDVP